MPDHHPAHIPTDTDLADRLEAQLSPLFHHLSRLPPEGSVRISLWGYDVPQGHPMHILHHLPAASSAHAHMARRAACPDMAQVLAAADACAHALRAILEPLWGPTLVQEALLACDPHTWSEEDAFLCFPDDPGMHLHILGLSFFFPHQSAPGVLAHTIARIHHTLSQGGRIDPARTSPTGLLTVARRDAPSRQRTLPCPGRTRDEQARIFCDLTALARAQADAHSRIFEEEIPV